MTKKYSQDFDLDSTFKIVYAHMYMWLKYWNNNPLPLSMLKLSTRKPSFKWYIKLVETFQNEVIHQ